MKRILSLLATLAGLALAGMSSAQPVIVVPTPTIVVEMPPVASYKNNPQLTRLDSFWLQLPFVDAEGIPGLYQDVMIEYGPQTQSWRLREYTRAIPVADIDAVNVIVTDELPAQVLLDITGRLTNGCQELGEVGIRQISDAFTVYVFYRKLPAPAESLACTADVRTFRKIVPLDVYGLPARTYAWTVNGEFSGSFTLAADNLLP